MRTGLEDLQHSATGDVAHVGSAVIGDLESVVTIKSLDSVQTQVGQIEAAELLTYGVRCREHQKLTLTGSLQQSLYWSSASQVSPHSLHVVFINMTIPARRLVVNLWRKQL